jgi:hypothetical protein
MVDVLRLFLVFVVFVLPLSLQPHAAHSAELRMLFAEERFIENPDATVNDTKQGIIWQKGDNGKEVAFENAEQYCKALRLGGYTDWRLPNAGERDTAAVFQLRMPIHSRDVHSLFDLYWSSDRTVLIPFNYHPSYGPEVSRTYFAREGTRAFVRCVRSLSTPKAGAGD